jgi:hypothetical protein
MAAMTRRLTSRLGIQQIFTTAYHPQGNGKTERINRVVNAAMRSYIDSNNKDWDMHISGVMNAINTSQHETTGHTPYALLFGRDARLPTDISYEMHLLTEDGKFGVQQTKRFAEAHSFVKEYQKLQAKQRAQRANLQRRETPLKVGDLVLLHDPTFEEGAPRRLQARWHPLPFVLTSLRHDSLTAVINDRNGAPQTVHVSRLRKFNFGDSHTDTPPEVAPVLETGPLIPKEAHELAAESQPSLALPPPLQAEDEAAHTQVSRARTRNATASNPHTVSRYVRAGFKDKVYTGKIRVGDIILYWMNEDDKVIWLVGEIFELTAEGLDDDAITVQPYATRQSKLPLRERTYLPVWIDPKAQHKEDYRMVPKKHYQVLTNEVYLEQIVDKFVFNDTRTLPDDVVRYILAHVAFTTGTLTGESMEKKENKEMKEGKNDRDAELDVSASTRQGKPSQTVVAPGDVDTAGPPRLPSDVPQMTPIAMRTRKRTAAANLSPPARRGRR